MNSWFHLFPLARPCFCPSFNCVDSLFEKKENWSFKHVCFVPSGMIINSLNGGFLISYSHRLFLGTVIVFLLLSF